MPNPKTFVVSTESINTQNMRVRTAGGNFEAFKANPVMLYNHKEDQVIGAWENLRVVDGQVLADPSFDLEDPVAAAIAGKVERGVIKAASISLRPVDAELVTENGREFIDITKWELREISIVSIPSNRSALRLVDAQNQPIELGAAVQLADIFPNRQNQKKDSNMEIKQLAAVLGLADTATEAEVLTAAIAAKEAEKNFATLRAKQLADQKVEAITLIDAAIAGKQLSVDSREAFVKLAESDFESIKKALQALPKQASLMDVVKGGVATTAAQGDERTAWNFEDWRKKDPKGLQNLMDKAPGRYNALFKAHYDEEPA